MPFIGIKLIDMVLVALRLGVTRRNSPCSRNSVRRRVAASSCLTLITGVVYPLVVTGIAQVVFPHQANGSLIATDGKAVGSALIGQPFDDPKYFWGRPRRPVRCPYNAGRVVAARTRAR